MDDKQRKVLLGVFIPILAIILFLANPQEFMKIYFCFSFFPLVMWIDARSKVKQLSEEIRLYRLWIEDCKECKGRKKRLKWPDSIIYQRIIEWL